VGGLEHNIEQLDGAAVVNLTGELDLSVADQLRDLLDDRITGGTPRIRIDMGGVRFIDSRAIGVLIGAQKRAESAGGGIRVLNPQPTVRKAFDILGLRPVFEID
jgi:anti-sigma B factor antagonist